MLSAAAAVRTSCRSERVAAAVAQTVLAARGVASMPLATTRAGRAVGLAPAWVAMAGNARSQTRAVSTSASSSTARVSAAHLAQAYRGKHTTTGLSLSSGAGGAAGGASTSWPSVGRAIHSSCASGASRHNKGPLSAAGSQEPILSQADVDALALQIASLPTEERAAKLGALLPTLPPATATRLAAAAGVSVSAVDAAYRDGLAKTQGSAVSSAVSAEEVESDEVLKEEDESPLSARHQHTRFGYQDDAPSNPLAALKKVAASNSASTRQQAATPDSIRLQYDAHKRATDAHSRAKRAWEAASQEAAKQPDVSTAGLIERLRAQSFTVKSKGVEALHGGGTHVTASALFNSGHRQIRLHAPAARQDELEELLEKWIALTWATVNSEMTRDFAKTLVDREATPVASTPATSGSQDFALLQMSDLMPLDATFLRVAQREFLASHKDVGFELIRFMPEPRTSGVTMCVAAPAVSEFDRLSAVDAPDAQADSTGKSWRMLSLLAGLELTTLGPLSAGGELVSDMGDFPLLPATEPNAQELSKVRDNPSPPLDRRVAHRDTAIVATFRSADPTQAELLSIHGVQFENDSDLEERAPNQAPKYDEQDADNQFLDNLSRRKAAGHSITEITPSNFATTMNTERQLVQDFLDMPPTRIRQMAEDFAARTAPFSHSDRRPVQFVTRHYITVTSDLPPGGSRKVVLQIPLSELELPSVVEEIFVAMLETRIIAGKTVRLVSDRFPLREQNQDYLRDLLLVLVQRAYELALQQPSLPLTAHEQKERDLHKYLVSSPMAGTAAASRV
ncbi:hypothetical protein CAOG_00749 [Capsaspora owczarzaki ATCC 30864]|uniref:Small ribosomal subunit protein mS35 mitochondrial conserved domain-containing protein n=1 Tax=Capsaspora owczarzaki (strain ATCC 30864) TaxID=595528 RepID=A0A0D2U1Z2_CAPO3|nr:hypothetical protein CAOG_00749 [Capsaspora owczarzaki ATCC 30864]KJE89236.1 hypothetical protein CAOG_000749 [Capsaspora owczarzaki ATCC 30864]|eukprot:XP_004365620.1 hypothetical protein CAOG_00749 [Capsaspora owczarzaki ATCC 30864]